MKFRFTTLLALTLAAVLAFGGCQKKPQVVAQAVVKADSICTLAVKGMTCATCPAQVRTVLKRVSGVADAKVTLTPPRATVRFDSKQANPKLLAAAPSGIGYPSKILSCGKL